MERRFCGANLAHKLGEMLCPSLNGHKSHRQYILTRGHCLSVILLPVSVLSRVLIKLTTTKVRTPEL